MKEYTAESRRDSWTFKPGEDRAEWLMRRRKDVTASVAAVLFGVHPYTTLYELWALKSGLVTDDEEESAPMRRGRLLEPVALQLLKEERPDWTVEACSTYFRDPVERIGATPDALAVDPQRDGFGVIQVKSVAASMFRRKWYNEDEELEPPLWIAIQAMVEAELTGASWAVIAALVVDIGADLHLIDVPLIPQIFTRLKLNVRQFWDSVDTKTPPPMDYSRDHELIFRARDDGSTVDLSADGNRMREMAADDAIWADEIKRLTDHRKAIKAEILAKMGPAQVATINGEVFATAKTVTRKEYTVKESQYRDLRIKRKDGMALQNNLS